MYPKIIYQNLTISGVLELTFFLPMDLSFFIIWMTPFLGGGFSVNVCTFIVFCIEIPERKQCSPRSNATLSNI